MAYSGFLIKVGDYTIPTNKYIAASSYTVTRNVQDLDSYRDANGELHRTALEHYVHKVEFETPALLTNTDIAELFSSIRKNYVNVGERKILATVYVPEFDTYESQYMYMSDPSFPIYSNANGVIKYNPIRIALIGY